MSRSLPSSLEGEENVVIKAPRFGMLSCELAAYFGDVPDNCFKGSIEDPDHDALIGLWNNQDKV